MRHRPWLLFATLVALSAGSACAPRSATVRPQHPLLRAPDGARPHHWAGRRTLGDGRGDAPSQSRHAKKRRTRIAKVAGQMVGKDELRVGQTRFRMDCSGIARGIYAKAGFPLGGRAAHAEENDVSILYRFVEEHGSLRKKDPLPGDLVFFNGTYDRNRDGRRNDKLTHVGVIETVGSDGTVAVVHRVGRGILRYRMNLQRPRDHVHPKTGTRLNHFLRRKDATGPARTTGELFFAYGTVADGIEGLQLAQR